ncbi:MAG: DEAD/DEAH box helicase, partial [Gammaproteobacteria bacterium]|nr:DEAD/DEAH box helicase [Gammaproteobacteria bacterium]
NAINLLPFIVNLLQAARNADDLQQLINTPDDKGIVLKQDNGKFLNIPFGKVRHIIETMVELYDPNSLNNQGKLELTRYQSNQLADLEGFNKQLEWSGGESLRKFGHKLNNFKGIEEVAVPSELKAELRDYQKEGLNWLQFLRAYDLGGILADDMGLGKTIQTLAHLLVEKKENRADRPSLVVAPTSLMVNWLREAEKFAPSLSVLVLQGQKRKQKFSQIQQHDVVLTTYPLLTRDEEVLLDQNWHLVILDEAQNIKNPSSKAAQNIRLINCRHRLCLTGTPMENHLTELWSQFHFLMPGILGDERKFKQLYKTPIEKKQDVQRQKMLRERIAPFMLRRVKKEVAKELPPKTDIISQVKLETGQRDLYETIRVSMHSKVKMAIDQKGMARSQIVILDALLKLRQVCCHPQLLKIESAKKVNHSAKLTQLMEMLPEMVEEGRKILLFSQFTSMLAIIEEELIKRKIEYVKLTGQTKDRATPIDEFQDGKVPVFLISLKAGGAGLNLTAADTVIHYDPWWNPAAENQATDRAYRIGQDKPVFVYKLITVGTVEEKILEMQAKKQALADALFSDSNKNTKITAEDLKSLFDPI